MGQTQHGMFPWLDLKSAGTPRVFDSTAVEFGSGSWTTATGVTGTFTKPMPIGNGKTIPPTGKRFAVGMATVAHWNANGQMDHEWLFWDSR